MQRRLALIYWKSDKFRLGKLMVYPEIMTQGETIEELEENIVVNPVWKQISGLSLYPQLLHQLI